MVRPRRCPIDRYNALPGDQLSFSLPAQNRGVLPSPSTEMEVIVPGGESSRQAVPSIDAYSEQRIDVIGCPEGATIGNQTLTFTVDPDEFSRGCKSKQQPSNSGYLHWSSSKCVDHHRFWKLYL